jgi:hypothetical protein
MMRPSLQHQLTEGTDFTDPHAAAFWGQLVQLPEQRRNLLMVAMRRELAAANPDRYRPDLARSLTNLASTLSALGRHSEAGQLRREADSMR